MSINFLVGVAKEPHPYYLTECQEIPASIILPFSSSYSKGTSSGILRIWKYTIEIP